MDTSIEIQIKFTKMLFLQEHSSLFYTDFRRSIILMKKYIVIF